ncbi:MAG: hypothetical protein LBR19_06775 [Bifidobacteriaceae bacterium]|nr:hypothetical protein [Bifidobacteriaceae bacterium]
MRARGWLALGLVVGLAAGLVGCGQEASPARQSPVAAPDLVQVYGDEGLTPAFGVCAEGAQIGLGRSVNIGVTSITGGVAELWLNYGEGGQVDAKAGDAVVLPGAGLLVIAATDSADGFLGIGAGQGSLTYTFEPFAADGAPGAGEQPAASRAEERPAWAQGESWPGQVVTEGEVSGDAAAVTVELTGLTADDLYAYTDQTEASVRLSAVVSWPGGSQAVTDVPTGSVVEIPGAGWVVFSSFLSGNEARGDQPRIQWGFVPRLPYDRLV